MPGLPGQLHVRHRKRGSGKGTFRLYVTVTDEAGAAFAAAARYQGVTMSRWALEAMTAAAVEQGFDPEQGAP